jgi:hypothetical protein
VHLHLLANVTTTYSTYALLPAFYGVQVESHTTTTELPNPGYTLRSTPTLADSFPDPFRVPTAGALVCAFAAFVATTAESWLGAAIQGRAGFEWLDNDVVNGVQIVLAAAIAVAVGGAVGA